MNNLTDKKIRSLKPGKYSDGRGLALLARESGKSWQFRFFWEGKEQTMSLGVWPDVTVEMARERLQQMRTKVAQGINPVAEKRAIKEAVKAETDHTFEAVSIEWLNRFYPTANNNRRRIEMWLSTYCYPHLGAVPMRRINNTMVAECLDLLVKCSKLDSAHRLFRVLVKIWRWAVRREYCTRNIVEDLQGDLPKHTSAKFPGLTKPDEVGDLLLDIDGYRPRLAQVKFCMQLMPYFAQRPSELREATWGEFDLKAALWRIPAHRMKVGKTTRSDHIVPIPHQALAILRQLSLMSQHVQVPEVIKEQIVELRAEGIGMNKIARLVGVGDGTVQKTLREMSSAPVPTRLSVDRNNIVRLRQPTGFLFPSRETRNEIDSNQPFSDATVNKALRFLGYCTDSGCDCGKRHHTGHGWRTTFSTLSREVLGASFHVKEAQLSHVTPGVAGVYDEATDLKARTKLMQEWADYLDTLREAALQRRPSDRQVM